MAPFDGDTEQDSQHFRIGHPLGERRVEAGATLLDKSKVKAGRKRDRLKVVGLAVSGTARGVTIISWNCRPVLNPVGRIDRLGKNEVGIQVGVFIVDAVPGPETGVRIELGEIGEPQLSGGALRTTARDGAKSLTEEEVKLGRRCTFRS